MKHNISAVIDQLLRSDEPSIRWMATVRVGGEPPDSRKVRDLQEATHSTSSSSRRARFPNAAALRAFP